MKKQLTERFQQLAGIKPLYELSTETMASNGKIDLIQLALNKKNDN